jgi:23S rRNA (guanosine2251-2'-O)-methyltransferase
VGSLTTALDKLREAGAAVVGLDAHTEHSIADVPFEGAVVLVIGAEGKGLRKPIKRACTSLAKLPMSGPIDSLNASVAGAIAIYEVVRRRSVK